MFTRYFSSIKEMANIAANLNCVKEKIAKAAAKRSAELIDKPPCLVAVSKLKPPEAIIEAYEAGQINFGENYVNELVSKATNLEILEKCKNIQWHFIGHLQTNKVNKLLNIPNLYLIETVDKEKLATTINNSWEKQRKDVDTKLKIMVQVNTSKEEEKNGCEIENVNALVRHVLEKCPNLEFTGLMTIGKYGYNPADGPNPDFLSLIKCRKSLADELQIAESSIELSMGMSTDFEHAILLGSTYVRVGTAIFGDRPPKAAPITT